MSMSRDRLLTLALATAGFSVSTVMRKLAVDQLHPLQYQAISGMLYAVLVPMIWLLNTKYGETTTWSTSGILWTLAATMVHVIAAFFFNNVLRSGNDAGVVSALSSASPVITLMLSFMILHEQPSITGMIGMAFVMLGICIMSF
jgi:uncharacterized membrane protein